MAVEIQVGGLFDAANLPPTTGMMFLSRSASGTGQVVTFSSTGAEAEFYGNFTFAADGKTILSGQISQLAIRQASDSGKTFLLTNLSVDVAPVLDLVNTGNASAILLMANGPDWHIHAKASESDLRGGTGNDIFHVSGVLNAFSGGAGIDKALFTAKLSPYDFPIGDMPALKVTSPGHVTIGANTFVDVERFEFANIKVAVDIDGNAGRAYRLYQAAFDRKPDLGGMGYQMNALDTGLTLEQVAANFIASPEFQQTYGTLADTAFVTQLYRNVLNREPEQAGLEYHLHDMQVNGKSRAQILANFSESPENQANVIGSIEGGIIYT